MRLQKLVQTPEEVNIFFLKKTSDFIFRHTELSCNLNSCNLKTKEWHMRLKKLVQTPEEVCGNSTFTRATGEGLNFR